MKQKHTKTEGGRVLRNAYTVEFIAGEWRPCAGGNMTIYEAWKEANRKNGKKKS